MYVNDCQSGRPSELYGLKWKILILNTLLRLLTAEANGIFFNQSKLVILFFRKLATQPAGAHDRIKH